MKYENFFIINSFILFPKIFLFFHELSKIIVLIMKNFQIKGIILMKKNYYGKNVMKDVKHVFQKEIIKI